MAGVAAPHCGTALVGAAVFMDTAGFTRATVSYPSFLPVSVYLATDSGFVLTALDVISPKAVSQPGVNAREIVSKEYYRGYPSGVDNERDLV